MITYHRKEERILEKETFLRWKTLEKKYWSTVKPGKN